VPSLIIATNGRNQMWAMTGAFCTPALDLSADE
jgi:hypothetical protein